MARTTNTPMRKIALLFVAAVFIPSLALAWLAIGSIRDQQIVTERRLTLLYHGATDAIARDLLHDLEAFQQSFHQQVQAIAQGKSPPDLAESFDADLRQRWPYAEVGYLVSLDGRVLSPSLFAGPEARKFRLENDQFLCGRESVEVYWSGEAGAPSPGSPKDKPTAAIVLKEASPPAGESAESSAPQPSPSKERSGPGETKALAAKAARKVAPTHSPAPE